MQYHISVPVSSIVYNFTRYFIKYKFAKYGLIFM